LVLRIDWIFQFEVIDTTFDSNDFSVLLHDVIKNNPETSNSPNLKTRFFIAIDIFL